MNKRIYKCKRYREGECDGGREYEGRRGKYGS